MRRQSIHNINQGDFPKAFAYFIFFWGAWSVFMEFGNHNHASIFFCQRTVSYLDFRKKNPLVLGLDKRRYFFSFD